MISITKLFGSYGANCKLDSFNDEMKFFCKNVDTRLVRGSLCSQGRTCV